MDKTTRIGRPPKPAKLKRTKTVHLLLTAAEQKALSKYAASRQTTISEVIRGSIRSLLESEGGKQ
jgi:hypothetical protein